MAIISTRAANSPPSITGDIDEPWLTGYAIGVINWFLEREMNHEARVLEWGAGTSTPWIAWRSRELWTVEHDRKWFELVKAEMRKLKECDDLAEWHYILAAKDELDYQSARSAPGLFDLILIDGRERVKCLSYALGKLARFGMLVFDNTDRDYDTSAVPLAWHRMDLPNGLWLTTIWRDIPRRRR